MNRETPLMHEIQLATSQAGARIFRNQVGEGRFAMRGCAYCQRGGEYVTFGLGPGSPDLVGWKTVTVTPEMVGKKLAVFVGIEVKVPGAKTEAKRLRNQKQFLETIQAHGGIAFMATARDEAVLKLKEVAGGRP